MRIEISAGIEPAIRPSGLSIKDKRDSNPQFRMFSPVLYPIKLLSSSLKEQKNMRINIIAKKEELGPPSFCKAQSCIGLLFIKRITFFANFLNPNYVLTKGEHIVKRKEKIKTTCPPVVRTSTKKGGELRYGTHQI